MMQEITVFNRFGDNAVLTKIVNRIPCQAMANKMTGDWHNGLVKDEQKAGMGGEPMNGFRIQYDIKG